MTGTGSGDPSAPRTAPLSVLVVDDDDAVRAGIETVIGCSGGELVLAGSAGSVAGTSAILDRGVPIDVAIVDLGLPDGHGSDVIERLSRERPSCAALVFTVFGDDDSIFRALRAGARGYLLKDASHQEVVEAVRHAWTGGAPMTPEVARRVVLSFRAPAAQKSDITVREGEVLELLCHGLSYAEVASALHIALTTVQSHVKNIYRKLDVTSRTEAMHVAIQQRLFLP